jgi:hypothetical protein
MATITNNMSLIDAATATTGWVPAVSGGAAVNTETFPPGATSSISDKVSNEVDGLLHNAGAVFAAGDHVTLWYNALFGALATRASGGIRVRFAGASVSDYVDVYVDGSDTGKSGWNFVVVSLDRALNNPDATGGTAPTAATSIQHVGIVVNITANVGGNNDNMAVGAIYRIPSGTKAFQIEGDVSSANVTWDDIATGISGNGGRGIVLKDAQGVFVVNGPLEFGDATNGFDTNIVDSEVVIAWGNQEYVEPDFFGFTLNSNVNDTTQINAGSKIGSGETAVGVSGWTIISGGPRWYWDSEDANQTAVNLYGCSFSGSSTWSINDNAVEIISCSYSNCDTITMTGGTSGPTILSTFFNAAPGPDAQVVFTSGVTPDNGQFDFNTFVNMKWFAIEVPSSTTAFDLRGITFAGNGTDRDVLLSHTSGDVQLNLLEGTTAGTGVTNGATITVTMTGACDVLAVTCGTWSNAQGVEFNDVAVANAPLTTQTQGFGINATDDSFSIAAAVPGGKPDLTGGQEDLTFTGASDDYEDSYALSVPSIGGGVIVRQGADELTPSGPFTTRTQFPVASQTETEGVQGLVAVIGTGGTVANLDATTSGGNPAMRPWAVAYNASTLTFSYGAGNGTDDANRFCYVSVVALDGTAANTAVSSVVLNRSGGTTAFTGRTTNFPVQDDNVGTTGRSLELDVFNYDVDTGGQDLDQGTFDLNNTVTATVNALTEGSSVVIIANETVGTITLGDVLSQGLADSTGSYSFNINYEPAFDPSGLDVVVRARNQGFPNAAIADDGGVQTDETTEANSNAVGDMTLLPASPVVGDAYYFGHNEEFGQMRLDLSQLGVGTWTITWEYYNGSTYTALSGVTDGTSGFTANGVVSWTIPGDWADDTQNGQGPFRYIRARLSAFTSLTTQPLGTKAKLDVTRYLPFIQNNTITGSGLTVTASWVEDKISNF